IYKKLSVLRNSPFREDCMKDRRSGDASASRRSFLRVATAGAVASTVSAPALWVPQRALAAPKSLTMMHESSFIPPFDAFFKGPLAAAYEKATGIKINYDIVSVGGLLTRVTTAAENGTG